MLHKAKNRQSKIGTSKPKDQSQNAFRHKSILVLEKEPTLIWLETLNKIILESSNKALLIIQKEIEACLINKQKLSRIWN